MTQEVYSSTIRSDKCWSAEQLIKKQLVLSRGSAVFRIVCQWFTHCCPLHTDTKSRVLPLQHTSVNLPQHVHHRPCLFQSLPNSEAGVSMINQLQPSEGGRTLGSGFPVMVLSRLWRCGQLPWEYQPGLSSDGSPSLSSTSFTGETDDTESSLLSRGQVQEQTRWGYWLHMNSLHQQDFCN